MKHWRERDRIIFHLDVNSAYLSFEAVYRLSQGMTDIDLRDIPSAVGGNPERRSGIILAKSIPAKKYNIQTGETLHAAYQKCPHLVVVKPSYGLYMQCSDAMMDILKEYSPTIQRFSIDEVFMDYTGMHVHFGDPVTAANTIRNRIHEELGFTVNAGISSNKLLAKMASDNMGKPNKTHELWPEEIEEKFWPMAIEDLFMCGQATAPKMHKLGIHTIGDLAKSDPEHIKYALKSHGLMLWQYANGIEDSSVRKSNYVAMKGLGNGTTIPYDIEDPEDAYHYLLSLSESIGVRLRLARQMFQTIQVGIRYSDLKTVQHQMTLFSPSNLTAEIYKYSRQLFDASWTKAPVRKLRIRISNLVPDETLQLSLFDPVNREKLLRLDQAIDDIRMKHGKKSIVRGSLLHSGVSPMTGGVQDDYPMMTSII